MLPTDRAVLRNLVIAIVASTGALLGIGAIFLERGQARPVPQGMAVNGQQGSVRSSAGGVPPAPVGTTTITSGQLERGASASGPAGVPTGSPGPRPPVPMQQMPVPMQQMPVPMQQMPQPVPHTHADRVAPPPTQMRGAPSPAPMAAPQQRPAPQAPPQNPPSPVMGVAPMGAPPQMNGAPSFPAAQQQQPAQQQPPQQQQTPQQHQQQQQQQQQQPPQAPQAGAGPFTTEPPAWGASALTPNAEAGAGPFVTDPSQAPPR